MIANVAIVLLLVRSITGSSGSEVSEHDESASARVTQVTESLGVATERLVTVEVPVPAAAPAKPQLARDRSLEQRLESLVRETLRDAEKLSGGKVNASNTTIAVHVMRPGERRELAARQEHRPLRPASNMKLVTSASALVALGSSWNFETVFHSSANIEDGVLRGDLVVRAGGDPFFDEAANGQVAHLFASAVRELREAGIREVAGRLILDQDSFLEPGPGPGWPSSNQYWQEHCALAAGFTANASCLTGVVEPRAIGALAWSEVRPTTNGLERSGQVKTVGAKSRLDIAVGATATTATLRGEIPASVTSWSSRFAHPKPVTLFDLSLRAALTQSGIRLHGDSQRQRQVPVGRQLAVLRTPLVRVLAPINADSNNAVADQLFFALGQAIGGGGTRVGGARAVVKALERLGVSDEGLVQVDGSGLSREDRVTARQLTHLLAAVLELDEPTTDAFLSSLAVSGRSGSLENRMTGERTRGRVLAKTGWIEGTGSLSGYARTDTGELLCFSILVDYPKVSGLNTSCWKPLQDRICEELCAWQASAEPLGSGKVR